jgi:hypothetical protein
VIVKLLAFLTALYYYYMCHKQKIYVCNWDVSYIPSFLGTLIMTNTSICTNAIVTEQSAMAIVWVFLSVLIVALDIPFLNILRELVSLT